MRRRIALGGPRLLLAHSSSVTAEPARLPPLRPTRLPLVSRPLVLLPLSRPACTREPAPVSRPAFCR
ncbi:hypothetical protein [Streptomyces sp. NPDC047043]|uniref:hypothetical protein n=1 Tax=Streptomyces sp. NPDC047043 TaxID=3154497 RepID=UPI0033E0F324